MPWQFYFVLGDILGLFQYFLNNANSKEMQISFAFQNFECFSLRPKGEWFPISISVGFSGYGGRFRLSSYYSSFK